MRHPLALLLAAVATASAAAQRPVPSHTVTPLARSVVRHDVREVARVNGPALMSDRLDAAVNSLVPFESFHRNIAADKLAVLRKRALEELIDDELKYQHGVKRGILVSNAEVREGLAQYSRKYPNEAAFEAALRNSGSSVTEARGEIRRAVTIRKTFTTVVINTCQVSRLEAERYFAANPGRFVEPEQLHVSAITVGVDPSGTSLDWTEARKRAGELLAQVRDGAAFEDVARAHSTDASRSAGGDMGYVHRGSLNEPLERAIKELPLGQVSDVVETLFGYHILRVLDVRPPQQKTFAEVGVTLRKNLTTERCDSVNREWVKSLRARAQIVLAE